MSESLLPQDRLSVVEILPGSRDELATCSVELPDGSLHVGDRLSIDPTLALTNTYRELDARGEWMCWDPIVFYGRSLLSLAREQLPDLYGPLKEGHGLLQAHVRAADQTGVSQDAPLHCYVPSDVFRETFRQRAMVIRGLYKRALLERTEELERWFRRTVPFVKSLHEIERARIWVNAARAGELLAQAQLSDAERRFARSVVSLSRGGFAQHLYDCRPGRTGRVQTQSGLSVMGIPHGPCRELVTSRFLGGWVYAYDFNAIDYRCIIAACGDPELDRIYAHASDFHERTCERAQLREVDRDVVKHATYIYAYGGTPQTVADELGLPLLLVQRVVDQLDPILHPVQRFRDELHRQAQANGFVYTPSGRKIMVDKDDHPGKVLGLFAQSYASEVFQQAVVAAVNRLRSFDGHSRAIFTVHDELVVDMQPDDVHRDAEIKDAMEWASGEFFAVKMKRGKSYGQVD